MSSNKGGRANRAALALVAVALLAGCGSKPAATPPAASFAAAAAAPQTAPAGASAAAVPSAVPAAEGKHTDSPVPASPAAAAPAEQAGASSLPQAKPAAEASPVKPGMDAAAGELAAAQAPQAPKAAAPAAPAAADKAPSTAAAAPAEAPAAAPTTAKTATNELKWSEFFDDDKQATPSNKFWDLNGKTVQIKGFMGEVLSFDKHWFLLIPKPGAECPFDNGDETYWNTIMIVYVPKDTKLRYTTGPLQITGRLDVGIKIDESGYKTMFRLYDAKFEKIKE